MDFSQPLIGRSVGWPAGAYNLQCSREYFLLYAAMVALMISYRQLKHSSDFSIGF